MSAAFFVVRATVTDPARRKAFDTWYQNEHLPDAAKSFGVVKAWRFWSLTEPSLHQATYQFADEASLDRAMKGADLKRLVADFNRDWPDVTRSRDLRAGGGVCGLVSPRAHSYPLPLWERIHRVRAATVTIMKSS
jgi:hypothetical protein